MEDFLVLNYWNKYNENLMKLSNEISQYNKNNIFNYLENNNKPYQKNSSIINTKKRTKMKKGFFTMSKVLLLGLKYQINKLKKN